MSKSANLETWQISFMATLLKEKQCLEKCIVPMQGMSQASCIEIYVRGYRARLTESLGETFEATWRVLGDELFFDLTKSFIEQTPSRSYDLSDYGNNFPDFLNRNEVRSEIPFISDLARFELLFKEIFHSGSEDLRENDLALAIQANPNLKLKIDSGVRLENFGYSVYDVWKLRNSEVASLDSVEWNQEQFLLFQKSDDKILIIELTGQEFKLLALFESPNSIDEAVDKFIQLYGEMNADIVQSLFSKISRARVLKRS